MTRTDRRWLIGIVLLGLIVRLGWSMGRSTDIDQLPDQREYLSLSQNLLSGHGLNFFDPRFHQTVYAYRTPGYPAFLAVCGSSIRVIRCVQSFVDVSTIVAVFLLARRLIHPATLHRANVGTVPLIAAGLLAFNPFFVYFSGLVLTETLYAALLAWSVYFLICDRWVVATVVLSASGYLRPGGMLVLPFLILAARPNNPAGWAYRLRNTALAMVIAVFLLAPWVIRNHHILSTWVWGTTNSGITLYDGFHSGATGASDQRFITELPAVSSMNEVQRSEFFTQQAMDWMRQYPQQIPTLEIKKLLRGWSPVPLSAEFGKPIYRWISGLYAVPFDLLCLIGLFSGRLSRSAKMLLTMPAIIVTLLQLMSVGSLRYRIPAEAPLAVIAAAGVADLFRVRRSVQANILNEKP